MNVAQNTPFSEHRLKNFLSLLAHRPDNSCPLQQLHSHPQLQPRPLQSQPSPGLSPTPLASILPILARAVPPLVTLYLRTRPNARLKAELFPVLISLLTRYLGSQGFSVGTAGEGLDRLQGEINELFRGVFRVEINRDGEGGTAHWRLIEERNGGHVLGSG